LHGKKLKDSAPLDEEENSEIDQQAESLLDKAAQEDFEKWPTLKT
jgi:hypothetical protein